MALMPRPTAPWIRLAVGTAAALLIPRAPAAAPNFARDIQPLLAAHCLKCHGPEKQKAGLRLDHRASALQGGDDGPVIAVGQSHASPLLQRVTSQDPDQIMPPEGSPLSPPEIALLRDWIDQGAPWPEGDPIAPNTHWSLQPLQAPALPADSLQPIDALIRARLHQDGLDLAPPADRPTLIRRLSFDLIGLPPSPEEIDAFVEDPSPLAYTTLVERLLASPHYGERWGRHWLDVARYTESQGFEYDRLRDNAWHYRDYVIKSFNADKPYDQFMREQIAGDVLEPVTSEGIVATSLLVCGPWDQAGNAQANATQRAITREDELEDMLGVVGQSFLGLTINCARCHTHKFDPIPHTDYYRLKSVFEGVKHGERSIASAADTQAREAEKEALQSQIAGASSQLTVLEADGAQQAAAQHPAQAAPLLGPSPLWSWNFAPASPTPPSGEALGGAAIANGFLVLPREGAYFQSPPLTQDIREKTLEAWVTLASLNQGGGGAISLERQDGSVFDALVFGEGQTRRWTAGSEGFARTRPLETPEEAAAADTVIQIAAVYRADHSVALFRNGAPLGQPYTPASPLQTFPAGAAHILLGKRHTGGGQPWLTGSIQQAALYDRALSPAEVADSFHRGAQTLSQSHILAALTPAQRLAWDAALAARAQARAALTTLAERSTAQSYVGVRVQPTPTRRLLRGEVNAPDAVVAPAALASIYPPGADFALPPDAPEAARRLKLADWLCDPRHPLPARVMANRVWHLHFGQGIVATPNDFGAAGLPPTHPALLDWLATQFIQSGWSVKALHRLILHSATYRQSSAFSAPAAARDADNLLLWRFPPRRLEAEAVRDSMLAVSGQLNPAPGGPGFRPFTTSEYGATFYQLVDRSEPAFNRRTIYRINVNSGKDPLLDAFDCPDPSVKTPRRGVTTTPLQALELMNNSFVLRQAKHLAERAQQPHPDNLPAAIHRAYRLALGRPPSPDEAARAAAAARQRGLPSVCWALLNSTEFVYAP